MSCKFLILLLQINLLNCYMFGTCIEIPIDSYNTRFNIFYVKMVYEALSV